MASAVGNVKVVLPELTESVPPLLSSSTKPVPRNPETVPPSMPEVGAGGTRLALVQAATQADSSASSARLERQILVIVGASSRKASAWQCATLRCFAESTGSQWRA